MSSFLPQLVEALRGMWQGRWVGIAVAWLAAIAGATFVVLTPDKYEASARVYVDTQSILKPLMAGLTVQPDVDQQVAILSRTLISRPNVEKLVRMTDMDLSVRTAQQRERLAVAPCHRGAVVVHEPELELRLAQVRLGRLLDQPRAPGHVLADAAAVAIHLAEQKFAERLVLRHRLVQPPFRLRPGPDPAPAPAQHVRRGVLGGGGALVPPRPGTH